jgi:putative ABC transport system permease protein
MSSQRSIAIAINALRRNKLQTVLTMTGMTIGVATVLTMVALGSGAQKAIQDQVRAAGMNVIVVKSGNYHVKQQWLQNDVAEDPAAYLPNDPSTARQWRLGVWDKSVPAWLRPMATQQDGFGARWGDPDDAAGLGGAQTLTVVDAAEIRRLPGVQYASAGAHDNVRATVDGKTWFTRLHGVETSMPGIKRSWAFPYGRFFNAREEKKGANVAVLGSIVSEKLFGKKDPTGESITIRGEKFEVVGVVVSSTWMVLPETGDDQFDAIYIPIAAAQRFFRRPYLDVITITTASTGEVTKVSKATKALLRKRHGLEGAMPDDFVVNTQVKKTVGNGGLRTDLLKAMMGNVDGLEKVTLEQLGKSLAEANETMTLLLAGIAAVSLIVSGIGIMNIMLLSVTERTREIGIRRAVGARSNDVMLQFLYEAILLSVTGGVLGIVMGVVASNSISQFLHWSTSVSVGAVMIAFGISAMTGILFGYYPARTAAKVTPMTSLRYE